ncbi:type II toxin-antitoxin system RelE/ParE family toxin [Paeniglutamicibacter gangotriensis]|uniref:type II toxin-antitoxin system RelE/ParE family toxin n=1 Tax=Paeniglutamicibacter gangotriensis TaxID=254787 RepID=UPI000349A9A9|nr:type II toxin-antitoxin system RelE/ParE family toxin [Paeniglutamicibacter gangotriensis]
MIRSFGNRNTERIWHAQYVKRIDRTVQRTAPRKLELIHAAKDVEDLRIPPGIHVERLAGDRRGRHSIRVNLQ